MYTKLYSAGLSGIEGFPISIEVSISNGMPKFEVVGLPDQAVTEARERVKAAITNTGAYFPARRLVINLAPANLRKTGSLYDLPFALGILLATEQTRQAEERERSVIFGELALDGSVRRIEGLFPMLLAAKDLGITNAIIPHDNVKEASVVKGISLFPVKTLEEAENAIAGSMSPFACDEEAFNEKTYVNGIDFKEVKGQESVKRAAMVAAAGGHNFMMVGPPGCGKTLIARRMTTILPRLTFDEAIEVTKIYSVMGMLPKENALITERPFRSPHHTASYTSVVGGGKYPRPGEVSLANHGVLFLDEFPEFERNALQALREPLEERHITISRAQATLRFPSNFMLVAAMNPCPCGYYGDTMKACTCSPTARERYYGRVSGPVLDRIDIVTELRRVNYEELAGTKEGMSSEMMRVRVQTARDIQTARFKGEHGIYNNAMMAPRDLDVYCPMDDGARDLLRRAVDKIGVTARSYDKIRKLARTIADLAESEHITTTHVAEAIQYRAFERMVSA